MYAAINLPFVGLNATPVTPTRESVASAIVIKLPYMGDPKKVMYEGADDQTLQLTAKVESFADPMDVLIRKVTRLSEMLGCTEEEAEVILFNRM